MKILIIDDDELMRMTCSNILKKAGWEVVEAQNGNVGLALYKQEAPDVVLTDILMPDKEGLQTILEIRALDPKAKIIAMSSGGEMQNMSFLQLAQKVGAGQILNKPVRPDDLLAALKLILMP